MTPIVLIAKICFFIISIISIVFTVLSFMDGMTIKDLFKKNSTIAIQNRQLDAYKELTHSYSMKIDNLESIIILQNETQEISNSKIDSLNDDLKILLNQCDVYRAQYDRILGKYRSLERDYLNYIRYNKKMANKEQ